MKKLLLLPVSLILGIVSVWAGPVSVTGNGQTVPSVRVAIISEEPSASPIVDLLTVELSHKAGVQLLERNEIDKIYREQSLSLANKDYLKLGEILGADGVLLLSKVKEGEHAFLQTRLVAVGPGVVIGITHSPWTTKEDIATSKWIISHFGSLISKLSVPASKAIPISILNFRSAVRSREGEELEGQFASLTAERLGREREFFVLERRRMELLGDEKELQGAKQTAFWNGGHLLEGIIDRDGYSRETVTLDVRLLPAKGGAPALFKVSGSRTNQVEVLDRLAEKVKGILKPGLPLSPWEPAAEAAAYYDEAKWAFKWGMLREAQEASESSWALGLRTKEAAELRIRTYAAEGMSHPPSWIAVNPHNPLYAGDPSKLRALAHALELYQEGFDSFLLHDPKPDSVWYHLGLTLLNVRWGWTQESWPSELMRQFHYFPPLWEKHKEELATVRSLMQSTIAMLKSQPAYTNLSPPLAIAELGGYWQDTPEQGLEPYRRLVDTEYLHSQRMLFAHHNLVGWTEADDARSDAVWRGFVIELCNSTNPVTRVEGYFLKFADAPTPTSQKERLREFINVAVENAVAVNNKMWNGGGLLDQVHLIIGDGPRGFYGLEEGYKMDIQFHDDFREAILNGPRVVRLKEMTNYLAGLIAAKKPVDPGQFDKSLPRVSGQFPFDGGNYGKVAATTLIPMLREYRREITDVSGQDETSQQPLLKRIDSLSSQLQSALVPPPATNAVAAAPPKPEDAKPKYTRVATRQLPPVPSPEKPFTNTVKATRFWLWPPEWNDRSNLVSGVGACVYRDGRVWGKINYLAAAIYPHKAMIFGLDPTTWTTERIELKPSEDGGSFEVLGDNIFLTQEDKVRMYSLKTRTWTDLPLPTVGRLTRIGDRLYAINDDSIVEISADGNSQTILASTRRRPAVSLLDSLSDYKYASLFSAPNGSVAALIKSNLYVFDGKSRNWAEASTVTSEPTSVEGHAAGRQIGFWYEVAAWGANRLYVPKDSDSAPMIVPKPASETFHDYLSGRHQFEDPLWADTSRYTDHPIHQLYWADGKAWLRFAPQSWGKKDGRFAVRHYGFDEPPALYVYWPDMGGQLELPMDLEFTGGQFNGAQLYNFSYGVGGSGSIPVQAVPTPSGIILVNHSVGLWLIPWSNLSAPFKAVRDTAFAQRDARAKAVDKLWAGLTEKYHLTDRRKLTEDQKELMINDPVYLELSLDEIDKNHNGRLDPEELKFFDANNDNILEPNEQAGLETTLNLLAQTLMDEYANRDGQLEPHDYDRVAHGMAGTNMIENVRIDHFDVNHDGVINTVELQHMIRDQIYRCLRPRIGPWADEPTDLALKRAVEESFIQRNQFSRRLNYPIAKKLPNGIVNRPATGAPVEQMLLEAAAAGDLAKVSLALEQGAKVDARDDRGWTPLMIAAQGGRLDIAKLLVEKGGDVNTRSLSKMGGTVLAFAIASGKPEIIGYLIDHGADIHAKCTDGTTPLFVAISYKKLEAAEFLILHGVRIDEPGFHNEAGEEFTPLAGSGSTGNPDMARLILKHGAKVDQTNQSGDTALMLMAKRARPEMVKLLLENGANPNFKGPKGHTALIYAGFNGRIENIKLLLAAGADPNATATDGSASRYDALDLAEQEDHPEAAELIRDAQRKSPRSAVLNAGFGR